MIKNENRPGYKNSNVGWIPEGWEDSRLGDICSMKSGETITSTDLREDGAYPCFGGNGLRGFTATFTHDGHFVLIGRQGALCGNIHRVSGKFFASEHAVVASPHISTYSPWLSETLKHKGLNRFSESSAQPGLSVSKVLKMRVPTPPLPEQKAIAEVLECWDKGIRNLELKIEKKRNVKKGLMQKLLSEKIRLPGFSKDWKTVNFLEAFEIQKGTKTFQVQTSEYQESGRYPIVDQGQKKIVAHTDIDTLYSMIPVIVFGDHTRIVKWIDFPFVIGADGTQLIRTKESADLHFGYFLISNVALLALGYSRHLKLLKEMDLKLPPLPEQQAIAKLLSDADSEIETMEKKLTLWKEQKKYLLNNLVTGTIRLPQFCVQETTQPGSRIN